MTTVGLTREREQLVRRGVRLTVATLSYNSLEGVIAVTAGLLAGSIALVGFGADSLIELAASITALWRLHADIDTARRERAEHASLRIIGALFLTLAAYVAYDALRALISSAAPRESTVGMVLAALSLAVMPLLARAKRHVAMDLGSGALAAEAQQTSLCAYLSGILLGGLVLNATLGWSWADPIAALIMVPIIAKEGVEGLRGESACREGSA